MAYTLSPDSEVWLSKADGSDRRPLTFPPLHAFGARWSPDGKQIAFRALTSGPEGQSGIYVLPAEPGGKPELLLALNEGGIVGWHSDGQSLLLWKGSDSGALQKWALYVLDLKTRRLALLPGSEGLYDGSLSPDGRYIAALTDANKSLVLFDLQNHRQIVLAQGAALSAPRWSQDGREVFFQDILEGSNQPIYRVRIDDHKMDRVTNFAQPFAADIAGYRFTGLTPDDSPLATLIRSNGDLYVLDVDFP